MCINFFLLELSDVFIVVILLFLAHLNSLILLRPDENEAFEYGIIAPTPTLQYHKNHIPFSWNLTEWYWLISGIVFLFKTDEYLLVLATTTLVFFIPFANCTSTEQVMSSINKTSNKIFHNSTFPVTLILSTITTKCNLIVLLQVNEYTSTLNLFH